MADQTLPGQQPSPSIGTTYQSADPVKGYAETVLDKYRNPAATTFKPGAITPFSAGVTPAPQVPMGDQGLRYPYFSPFVPSNEELYAGAQSWYSKAGNAITKSAGLAAGTFLNGTVGLIAGLNASISDGKFSSFYDNSFSRSLDSWNKKMEDQFPNYYTQAETNADWYSPKNLFTANFLFDKVIKNLGYSVGALAAGMTYAGALRSIGLFSKIASAGGLAATAESTEQAIAAVPQIERAGAVELGIKNIATKFLSNYNALNKTQRVIAAGLSTLGEAGFEALQAMNDYRTKVISSYVKENGIEPTGEDLAQINHYSENVGSTVWGLNIPLLTLTNYVQLPKIIGSSYAAEKSFFNNAVQQIGEIAFDKQAGKYLAKIPGGAFGKALYKAQHIGSLFFSPSEAFEELSQSAFVYGVNNYTDKARAGKQTNILADIIGEGYHQALTTKDGIESLLIGGLSGGIFEFAHKIKHRGFTGTGGIQGVNTQAAVTAFNQKMFSGYLGETIEGVNRGAVLGAQRAEAIRRGDFLEAKDLQADYAHNYLMPRIKYGRLDIVKDDIEQYRKLASTDEGLQQLKEQGIISENDTKEQLLGRLDNFEKNADNINLIYQALHTRYGGILTEDNKRKYPDQVIDKMTYAAAKVADYDLRIPDITARLLEHGISVQPVLDTMTRDNRPSEEPVKTAIDQITGLDALSEVKDGLRSDLRDIAEITLRRKDFLKEYDTLKQRPQQYITDKYGTDDLTQAPDKMSIEQKDAKGDPVTFDLLPDKRYPLDDVMIRSSNKLQMFPALDTHYINLLGEMTHTSPSGEIAHSTSEEMGAYNLNNALGSAEQDILRPRLENILDRTTALAKYNQLGLDLKDKSFEQKMAAVNDQDHKRLADELEKKFAKEIKKFDSTRKKIKDYLTDNNLQDKLADSFRQSDNEAGNVSTADPVTDAKIYQQLYNTEDRKKHISIVFRSSTSQSTDIKGSGENDDFHRRANKFLNNIERIPDVENIKVIAVTRSNQNALGLTDLIPPFVSGTDISADNIDEGVIRLAFIRSLSGKDHFIDMDGNNLAPVGSRPDFNSLVYTSLPNTSLTWRNNEPRYISTGKNAVSESEAELYRQAWRLKRGQLLTRNGSYEVFDFSVSKGIANFTEGARNSVTTNLVNAKALNGPLIIIPTHSSGAEGVTGSIIHGEQTLELPLGRPMLQKGSILAPLNNRKLTASEKNTITRLIPLLARSSADSINQPILNYLRGILYWRAPAEGKSASANQIWFNKGYLYLGSEKLKVPFIEELLKGSKELSNFLDNAYISVNNFLLTQKGGESFNEISGVTPEGELQQIQWKSYQHFLLDDHYTTTQDDTSGRSGNARSVDSIPLTTDITVTNQTGDIYSAPFEQKYITISDPGFLPHVGDRSDDNDTAPTNRDSSDLPSPAPGEENGRVTEGFDPIINAGDFVLDGVTMNKIIYKGKLLANVAAVFTADGVSILKYEHLANIAITDEVKQMILEVATVNINKAVVEENARIQREKSQMSPAPVTAPTEGTSSSERTVDDIFNNLHADRGNDDVSAGQFRVLSELTTDRREDLDIVKTYHERVLPQVPLHIVDRLIITTDGGAAWGALRDNAIYLYEHAELGTIYHEVFEGVYNLFLEPAEQRSITREFRQREGSFTDRETGKRLPYADATDHQAKEQMAEEFRQFNLENTLPPGPKQVSMFRRLIAFIKSLLGIKQVSAENLFSSIQQGKYAKMPVPTANKGSKIDNYSRLLPGLNTKFIHESMQGITALIFERLFENNSNIVDFDERKVSLKSLYDQVYKSLEERFEKTLPSRLLAEIQDAALSSDKALEAKQRYADFLNNSWIPIKNNWKTLTEINQQFLKQFNIVYESADTADELQATDLDDNTNNREYERDILRISARKNASTAVKLLFSTLTQVEPVTNPSVSAATLQTPPRKLSTLKLPLLVPYARTFNQLLYATADTNGLKNIIARLKSVAGKNQDFVRLIKRLKVENGYDHLSIDDWKLLNKLYNTLSRQRPDFLLQVTDESGKNYLINADENLQSKQFTSAWLNNLRAGAAATGLVYHDNFKYRINTEALSRFNVRDVAGKISFLNAIGIDFPGLSYESLSAQDKRILNSAVQHLFNQLKKSEDIATLSGRALGITGPISKIAGVITRAYGENTEAQHFNIEGNPVQNLLLHNYVSVILADIAHYQTRDELLAALPHLNDRFSADSLLLAPGGLIYDDAGKRREENIGMAIIEGTKQVSPRAGITGAALSLKARRMLEFNQNLNGIFNILVPADSKTEWALNLKNQFYIPFADFANPGALYSKIYRIFSAYLSTEIQQVIRNKEGSQVQALKENGSALRFFKNILSSSLNDSLNQALKNGIVTDTWIGEHNQQIRKDISNWLEGMTNKQFEYFQQLGIITAGEFENYNFNGLDSDFVQEHSLSTQMSEPAVKQLIRFRTLNYAINNIELHKVFFGDPALYSDATKRIKSFLSGRENTYHTDLEFNVMAASRLNVAESDGHTEQLRPGDPGFHVFRDFMPSVTVTDINVIGQTALNKTLPENIRAAYESTNEADAQSWMRITAFRELLHKAGGRWTTGMEKQFQYELSYERQARAAKGTYQYTNQALKNLDENAVKAGNPESGTFYVIKPIGSGVKAGTADFDVFLDKTSTIPMFYRILEDTAMEQLYLQMEKQDTSYVITASGRKVGAENLHDLYNPDGTINDSAFNNRINIPFKYYGIQVETGSHASGQIRGSQITKLITINLLSDGIPVDVKMPLQEWNGLSETDKRQASPIYDLVKQNKSILDAITGKGYNDVLKALGITETDAEYSISDYSKVTDLIKNEIDRRELPENLKDAISLNAATGEFTIPLEASTSYKTIKNIIYSVVDRMLLSPKMPGGPKVQISSALFEKNGRQAVYKPAGDLNANWAQVTDYNQLTGEEKSTVRLTSSDLSFYRDGQPYMEVYLPAWFKQEMKRKGFNKSDAELISYLDKNSSKLLTGIGFRIPTQELNSIERIKVKGFLPQQLGDSIVVPSEITTKAGSDFDIDKLNTYLKHFHIGKDGFPETIDFEDADTSTEEGLQKLYTKFYGSLSNFITNVERELAEFQERGNIEEENQVGVSEDASRLISRLFGNLADDLSEIGIDENRYKQALSEIVPFEKFKELYQGKDIYQVYATLSPKALENAYIENMEALLSLPQNYERLLQPNSARELMDIRDELLAAKGIAPQTKGNFSLLLDPMYMSQVRHNFLAGKGGVGIAALQQVNTALAQLTTIVINPVNFASKLTALEASILDDLTIALPHNTVTYDDNSYITLSSRFDSTGKYISDKISAYINGYVDAAKDPFIIEIGANLSVASTFLFLEKAGVPTRDVIMFMNQPIIADFLKTLEIRDLSSPVSSTTLRMAGLIKNQYPTTAAATGPINTAALKDYIIKQSRGQKFTDAENGIQQQILNEFFKYYILSSHLFKLSQSSNYDTANFNDPALIYRKQQLTSFARSNNLLSSIDKILNNSFLGELSKKLGGIKSATGQIFKLDKPAVAAVLENVMDDYLSPERTLPEDEFLAVSAKIQSSFLDYITQIYGSSDLTNRINELMVGKDSVASQLKELKSHIVKDTELALNPVLNNLNPLLDATFTTEPQNIKLVEKAYDAYTSNIYTDSMRELRDNIVTSDFYRRLVALSILQSGVGRSPISFTDILPIEDYAPYLADVVSTLDLKDDLQYFAENNAFQRVNWADERIVPTVEPREVNTQLGSWVPLYSVPSSLFTNLGITDRNQYDFIQLNTQFQSWAINYPVVKVKTISINPDTGTAFTREQQAEMRKRKDFSFYTYKLYRRVDMESTDGKTTSLSYQDTSSNSLNIIYKQINAWGKPGLVQEYYNSPRSSILPLNIGITEFSDADIVRAFKGQQINPGISVEDEQGTREQREIAAKKIIERLQGEGLIDNTDC